MGHKFNTTASFMATLILFASALAHADGEPQIMPLEGEPVVVQPEGEPQIEVKGLVSKECGPVFDITEAGIVKAGEEEHMVLDINIKDNTSQPYAKKFTLSTPEQSYVADWLDPKDMGGNQAFWQSKVSVQWDGNNSQDSFVMYSYAVGPFKTQTVNIKLEMGGKTYTCNNVKVNK